MKKSFTSIDAAEGGRFDAYVSTPSQANGQAVIVLQEIFGVTSAVRGIADRFAQDGYLAFAPDLFWREQAGIELSHSREDIAKAMAILARYRDDDGLSDVGSTVRHILGLPGFTGKIAVAGMCLGGKLAYLAATRADVDAAVAFYGVGIETRLDMATALKCPLLLHFGDQDSYVPALARQQIGVAFDGRASVQLHVYAGAGHGFYTRGNPADVALARERTNAFLQQQMRA